MGGDCLDRATRLADLYKASVQEYTKTPEEWKGLLSCVARFYKRSFDNVVLIGVCETPEPA